MQLLFAVYYADSQRDLNCNILNVLFCIFGLSLNHFYYLNSNGAFLLFNKKYKPTFF